MTNTWRKLITVILCCSLLLITSCQSTQQVDSNITKVTLWHGINPPENRDVFNELVTQFNQDHSDIEVEALYIGQPDAQLPKIFAATVSGEAPDMLWFVPQLTGELNKLGVLLPLEDWFNNSDIKAEVDPAMLDSMTLDNHILSIPFATNNAAVFFRPDLFKQAGITETPKTWEAFQDAAKKLTQDTNNDGRIDQQGIFLSLGKGEWTVFTWLPFIYSGGGELINNNQPNLVTPGAIKALQFGADLVASNSAMLSAPERGYEMDNFISGKVAMQVTGPWTLGQLATTNIDYDVFPFPVLEQPAAVIGGENLFVFKSNEKREQASKEFLEYVLSEEFQTTWALKTGYLPINLKSQQSKVYQDFVQDNPVLEVFLEQMKFARSRPIIPKYTRLSENLGRAIEASLLGKESPEEALKQSQQRLDLIFN
ncbi:ABC-type sugar transport system, periplasmic component [Hyella patelloides LEGE 07179]|uniref:ABC-type sugar transport system, periplasmic component n=1 Tax=Hyella patelloides LEGE 07179 TaxID=945734 RepID=A0A563W4U7_9CYAN|nr:ABC transporter substrate-binding protein [Hyella patelloides]VEP18695.1 ABC-type sugar transport system, periplasmic component [Hyella patelloides LEGE 07179]